MAKMKDLNLSVPKDNIMYTNISKSKDGYNSARLVAKMGEKEYMSISYEWEGDGVPGFAMDLMGAMQEKGSKVGSVVAGFEDEYEEFACATCDKHNAKEMKNPKEKMDEGVCPDCGKKKEECVCKSKKGKAKAKKGSDGTKPVPGDTTKKHSPKVCPNCGLAEEDCTCDGKKQLEKTREKRGKEKKA